MQEQYIGRLTPDIDVRDMDGHKIGTLARVYRDEPTTTPPAAEAPSTDVIGASGESGIMEVKTGPLGLGERLYIPISAIHDATEDSVFLGSRKDELAEEWHHKPDYLNQLG
jgi:hypothetical protein